MSIHLDGLTERLDTNTHLRTLRHVDSATNYVQGNRVMMIDMTSFEVFNVTNIVKMASRESNCNDIVRLIK